MKAKTILFALILHTCIASAQKVERVEPPNWWTGMKHNTIQLLVYGKNISELIPKINYENVSLERTIKVSNSNYLFLYLDVNETAKAGTIDISFYNGEKLVGSYPFKLLDREKGSAEIVGFNSSDVMYLITPDRFVNGNQENDNIDGMMDKADPSSRVGRHGGDLKGIQDKLDYIADMGFTAIWVNPVLENDMPRFSYHGYAATDFYKVDRRFGTNEEYKDFCALAKKKGLKIIMDMILNHCGSEHWFVKDPPTKDWINFQDNYTRTSHKRNTVQDIYASEYDKKAFSDGWFVRTMPDLNQKNDLMADYLILNTIWWIEYAGISGIRMDTYPYPDKDFMSKWTCEVMQEYPNFNIVGEEWTTNPAIVSYWQRGKVNHDGYISCLPSLMDFPLQDAIVKVLNAEEKRYSSSLSEIYEALTMDFLYSDPNNLVIFPDNHDMDRYFTQVNGDFDLYKMGLAYLFTIRGIPQIYYGTEVLMANDKAPHDHGIIRSQFPGGWPNHKTNAFTGKGLSEKQKEAQAFMKKILNWRKNKKVIHQGKLMQFAPEGEIYAFFRYDKSDKIMVILNKTKKDTDLTLERFHEILKGDKEGTDVLTGKKYNLETSIILPKKSALILEVK